MTDPCRLLAGHTPGSSSILEYSCTDMPTESQLYRYAYKCTKEARPPHWRIAPTMCWEATFAAGEAPNGVPATPKKQAPLDFAKFPRVPTQRNRSYQYQIPVGWLLE
jgi:hypothetical protein